MNRKSKIKNQKPKVRKKPYKRAVVLLSGGLDSAVALYLAKDKGYKTYCLSFDYGQRHKKEIVSAEKIARKSASMWRLIHFELPWKGSSLLDKRAAVPKNRRLDKGIPSTYVPARNIIFLSMAASYAEVIGAEAIFIGANQIDFSGYPDCRKGFLRAFEKALEEGTKQGAEGKGIRIHAPLLNKDKAQIVKLARRLKVPLELTWSCYQGKPRACGVCDSCRLRSRGFAQAGISDPAL
ncbi:MAG: 7-cyano-7-deazaguanine synthase QueC [Candidatus Omnitrophica bacterium]|nr:7-cyano-7-deazaguanine synthase QueC [Candidatus Omnitrophota bacterium]MBU4478889.1 7-cyano-7-deazaguanine synthase QueC [Candidatus Omnitrophota bacterium]MCG2702957.1 7-cyano-7-deazaguanine synthase QueC [Candidatus Omnitrophota bacterium]